MAFWSCARLEPRREAVAQHFLKLAGYEVYIPQVREQRLRRSRRVEVISPLFPAYAFIVIERQWHSARWTIGVTAIIMDGATPARVPDQVIDEIRRREVRGCELPKLPSMRAGDRVRVLRWRSRDPVIPEACDWRAFGCIGEIRIPSTVGGADISKIASCCLALNYM
jgi:hypothetical protein